MPIKSFKKYKAGFSLVEMLIYVGLLTMILTVLVSVVFSFTRSYEQIGALRAAEHTGLTAVERIIRDVHSAVSIDTSTSVFGVNPGSLTLINGTSTTKFYLSSGELRVDVDGNYIGPLSQTSAKVTSLIFTRISTPESEAVKIDMSVDGVRGLTTKTKIYHSTATLKKS